MWGFDDDDDNEEEILIWSCFLYQQVNKQQLMGDSTIQILLQLGSFQSYK